MLNKTRHPELLELLLRNFLDLSTYYVKTKMIEVLALVDCHSMVFTMTLGDTIKRLFSLREILNKPKLGLDKESPLESATTLLQ